MPQAAAREGESSEQAAVPTDRGLGGRRKAETQEAAPR